MPLSRIRELREKRGRIVDRMQQVVDEIDACSDREKEKELRHKYNSLNGEQKIVAQEIEDLTRANEAGDLVSQMRATKRPPEAQIDVDALVETGQAERRYAKAFTSYLRHGMLPDGRGSKGVDAEDQAILLSHQMEKRDLGITTGSLGGFFVPQGYVYQIEQAMKWYGGMLEATDSMDTSTGNPLPWPTDNDTSNEGELVAEGAQVTTQDASIGHITFNAWKYSTKLIKVSIELLQDSAFDIENYLMEKFAIRLGRKLNADFTNGSGSSQPMGLVTAVVANNGTPQAWGVGSGPGVPLIAAGSAANDGGSETGATSIGSQDLVNLEHSVDKAYRTGAAYMMNDLTLRYIKTLLDKYGRPLWQAGLKDGQPDRINGYPFYVNNDMAPIAAGANTVLFGNLKKYMRRNVKELAILRLAERFADYGQVAFVGFARKDGNLLDAGTHPVNYLQQHS